MRVISDKHVLCFVFSRVHAGRFKACIDLDNDGCWAGKSIKDDVLRSTGAYYRTLSLWACSYVFINSLSPLYRC